MSWVKITDDFFLNEKIAHLLGLRGGHKALCLHLSALAYAAGQLTDGRLTQAAVSTAARLAQVPPRLALLLYEVGLWEEYGTDALIHNYLKYNLTRQAVEQRREQGTERVRQWRKREGNSVAPQEGNSVTGPDRNAVGNAAPVPSHPVP